MSECGYRRSDNVETLMAFIKSGPGDLFARLKSIRSTSAEALALDDFEMKLLEVARFFFLSFAKPESEAWIEAFWRAERHFPAPFGATIAHAILIALSEIRAGRERTFEFLNPNHPSSETELTDQERYLMLTFRAARDGNRSAATANALLLCECEDTTQVLAAVERLAMITGDIDVPQFN